MLMQWIFSTVIRLCHLVFWGGLVCAGLAILLLIAR